VSELPLPARIAALRDAGAAQRLPVRWQLIDALSRRAAARAGLAREMLDRRLLRAVQDCEDALAMATMATESPQTDRPAPTSPPVGSPLAALLAHVDAQNGGTPASPPPAPKPVASPMNRGRKVAAARTPGRRAPGPAPTPAPMPRRPRELKAVQLFERTWSRLSAEQRYAQATDNLPGQAGPLNSQHLLHRSLQLMRALSPAYFEHFIAHADALLWLEEVNAPAPPPAPARR